MKDLAEAICRTRRKQMNALVANRIVELLERGEIVKNPEAAPIGSDYEIFEMVLHGNPVNRCVRQIVLQRLPVVAVIKGNVERVLGARVQQTASSWILLNGIGVAEW